MVKKILIGVAALVAVLLVVIAMQPSDFVVSRAMIISAKPEAIFPQIDDHRNFLRWSPWAKMDSSAVYTYEGPKTGVGSIVNWSGEKIGDGKCEIMEVVPNKRIMMKLTFIKPMKAVNEGQFLLEEKGEQTLVTWSMTGQKNFVAKAMGLFMGCEKMMAKQFDEGLTNLKNLVEAHNQ